MAPSSNTARTEAEALLRRLTMRNLRSREIRTGIYWTGVLTLDGQPILQVTQTGRGEATRYEPATGSDFASARKIEALLTGACTVLGLGDFEALDALTSAMENGQTGFDALSLARSAME